MKNYNYIVIILCFFSIVLSSCTTSKDVFTKRKYRNGYYVQLPSTPQNKTKTTTSKNPETPPLFASTLEQSNILLYNQIKQIHTTKKSYVDSLQNEICDIIILKTGEEIKAKVMEIGADDIIKYKRCDNLDGPVILIKKSSIFMIKYPNGIKEIIKSTESVPTVQKQEKTESTKDINTNTETNTSIYKKQNNETPKSSGHSIGSISAAIAGLLSPSLGIALVFSLAALILGILGIIKGRLKGLAIVGVILGGVMLLILLLALLLFGFI